MEREKNSVEYVLFNPRENEFVFSSLINCYRKVFGDEPWNEWKVCRKCGKKWGITQESELRAADYYCCDQKVEDFWPSEKVREDFLGETQKDASCWLAIVRGQVIGFTLGYRILAADLARKLELLGLAEEIEKVFRIKREGFVAYQDELGVLRDFRRRGIGKKLYESRKQDFLKMGLRVSIIRTMSNSGSVVYPWYKRLGYNVLAEYNDKDKRVVLGREI